MVSMLPPCVYGSYVVDYLNLYEVRDALFIPEDVQAWTYCVNDPTWTYKTGEEGSYDIYKWMQKNHPDVKILIYSGDTDGSVPTVGTLGWLESLEYEVSHAWAPYYWQEDEVSGYITKWDADRITFGSVHGCGHMAP